MSSTLGSRDYPDWNRPLTRVASAIVAELSGDLPAGNGQDGVFTAAQIDDVVVFYGALPDGVSLEVLAVLPGLSGNIGQRVAVGVGDGSFIVLPVQTFGQEIIWGVFNNTLVDTGFQLTVIAFSGANVDTLVASGFVFQGGAQEAPAMADTTSVYVGQGFLMDRLTLTVECTVAATVTLRRAVIHVADTPSVAFLDEVVATLAANTPTTVDVALGCSGSAFFLSVPGAVDGTFSYVGRAYRAVGN